LESYSRTHFSNLISTPDPTQTNLCRPTLVEVEIHSPEFSKPFQGEVKYQRYSRNAGSIHGNSPVIKFRAQVSPLSVSPRSVMPPSPNNLRREFLFLGTKSGNSSIKFYGAPFNLPLPSSRKPPWHRFKLNCALCIRIPSHHADSPVVGLRGYVGTPVVLMVDVETQWLSL
jgi:hypothetical protein